jgi:hypothetical protein
MFITDMEMLIELIEDFYPAISVLPIYHDMNTNFKSTSLLPDITYLTVSKMSKYVSELVSVIEPIPTITHFSNKIINSGELLMDRLGAITVSYLHFVRKYLGICKN